MLVQVEEKALGIEILDEVFNGFLNLTVMVKKVSGRVISENRIISHHF